MKELTVTNTGNDFNGLSLRRPVITSVIFFLLVVSVLIAPLGQKIVSPNLPYQDSHRAETFADGVLWHPLFDFNCYGELNCSTPPIEHGQSLGTSFIVLSEAPRILLITVTFIVLYQFLETPPRSFTKKPPITPPRF